MARRRSRRTWGTAVLASAVLLAFSFSFLPSWAATPPGAEMSVVRINSGGPSIVDSTGRTWRADQFAIGGHAHTVAQPIAGTQDDALFQSERWGTTGYDIPVANGNYTLQLLFAEINPSSGTRVMDIAVNGTPAVKGFQIASTVGTFRAYVHRIPVAVSSGMLRIRLAASSNSTSIAGVELVTRNSTSTSPTTSATSATSSTAPKTTAVTAASVPSGWRLVTSDNFDGNAINTTKWGVYSGPGNEGVGWRSPSHVNVSGGYLNIVGSGNTGGGVAMKTNQTYGRWEIRARQDWGNGYGPAILLWPASEQWPEDGEIDIAEIPKGERVKSHFTVHWGAENSQKGFAAEGDFTKWHTWTLEWSATAIKVWIDGQLIGTITDPKAIPDGPMHLALQNDVGAAGHWIPARDAQTPTSVRLQVDSVKVYKK